MKRLVLLTLILVPSAFHMVGNMASATKPPVAIGPRTGRLHNAQLIASGSAPASSVRELRHLPSATPERAREEVWELLTAEVSAWLAEAHVPEGWSPPGDLLRSMVREGPLETDERDYGTIYIQPLLLDASEFNRDRLVEAYERDLAGQRLAGLAGLLAFVLTCLGSVAGYIHADEATRGYYTNTLRVAAVGTVGAVGAILYLALA